mmetsp:Transcript_43886/g.42410  ORF Transcript_43886/g.42410 Transcript_43886/m.42410 type:complete len:142 (-) Transcript_43886:1982-2407(-)
MRNLLHLLFLAPLVPLDLQNVFHTILIVQVQRLDSLHFFLFFSLEGLDFDQLVFDLLRDLEKVNHSIDQHFPSKKHFLHRLLLHGLLQRSLLRYSSVFYQLDPHSVHLLEIWDGTEVLLVGTSSGVGTHWSDQGLRSRMVA